MGKLTPITEQFQHFVEGLKESFWGDLNRRFRAFDPDTGGILWETILGGIIQNNTITYSVNGKQYVAVLTGDRAEHTRTPLRLVRESKPPRGHN